MVGGPVAGERPSVRLSVAVLAACGAFGFVCGGVLASLGTGGGGNEPGTAPSDNRTVADPIALTVIDASCERDPAIDGAGNEVRYSRELAADGDSQTGWQCVGDGVGETLELDLGEQVAVAAVGLIPGYAKVDPVQDTEWYPLFRRLTEVRWHFDDGTTIDQELDPDPALRDLQTLVLDEPIETSRLRLEIVSSTRGDTGDRDRIAVSNLEVRVQ